MEEGTPPLDVILLQEVGQEAQRLGAHELVGVSQAGRQTGDVGVHQGGVVDDQVGEGHHDVVANRWGGGTAQLLQNKTKG